MIAYLDILGRVDPGAGLRVENGMHVRHIHRDIAGQHAIPAKPDRASLVQGDLRTHHGGLVADDQPGVICPQTKLPRDDTTFTDGHLAFVVPNFNEARRQSRLRPDPKPVVVSQDLDTKIARPFDRLVNLDPVVFSLVGDVYRHDVTPNPVQLRQNCPLTASNAFRLA